MTKDSQTTLDERLIVIYGDDSFGVCPKNYTLEMAKAECHDRNELDRSKQAKIGKMNLKILEIVFDPEKGVEPLTDIEKKIAEFVSTPEGMATLERISREAREASERVIKDAEVTDEQLHRRVTI